MKWWKTSENVRKQKPTRGNSSPITLRWRPHEEYFHTEPLVCGQREKQWECDVACGIILTALLYLVVQFYHTFMVLFIQKNRWNGVSVTARRVENGSIRSRIHPEVAQSRWTQPGNKPTETAREPKPKHKHTACVSMGTSTRTRNPWQIRICGFML